VCAGARARVRVWGGVRWGRKRDCNIFEGACQQSAIAKPALAACSPTCFKVADHQQVYSGVQCQQHHSCQVLYTTIVIYDNWNVLLYRL
jgi:hypothetical protein